MWTPKRILILVGGLILFLTGFGVYAYFLGGIDGLPPLPEHLKDNGSVEPLPPDMGDEAVRKLRMALGGDCPELKWQHKLDLRSKGWVLATETLQPKGGKLLLEPFSACIFPKMPADAKFPEINTIRCDSALVTFDQPVASYMDLNNRKVVKVELKGKQGVVIKNNRQTPDLLDDIEVTILQQPLFYEEKLNLIWTDGTVRLLDLQSQPHATEIMAEGMELHLAKGTPPPAGEKRKHPPGESINGVEQLVLRNNVDMKLCVDPGSGFLGSDVGRKKQEKNPPGGAASPAKPQEKSRVFIRTPGKFTYDLLKETAVFESPVASAEPLLSPPQVLAERVHEAGPGTSPLWDRLVCDRLELRFRRKKAEPGPRLAARDTRSTDKEIDSALATGKEVHLAMDTENLSAHGVELFFQSATETSGPQTAIKGQPLRAEKDYHKLVAQELHLVGADKNGEGQQARAKGPGRIDIFDKTNPVQSYPMHAVWKDQLTSTKVKEGNKVFDLLTLIEDAAFEDDVRKQKLHGDRLEVLLEPTNDQGPGGSGPLKQNAPGAPRQKPYKIDAFGKVWASSPEFIVKRADFLAVRFQDDVPRNDQLPETIGPAAASGGDPKQTSGLVPGQGQAGATPDPQDPNAKPRPPVELEGRLVTAVIKRGGIKDQLHELIVDGAVHVHQDGEKAEDKGVDIKGRLLQLVYHPKGHILYVYAEEKKDAELQLGELFLQGPKVTINQQDNTAEVDGVGAMEMPSSTSFDGGKPARPGARLRVDWNKNMVFDGQIARFYGGIQARQDNAWLRCDNLQVKLDRLVSFKEGQKNGQNAKADKIVCELKVHVVDEAFDEMRKLLKRQELKAVCLTMDNLDDKFFATGPGEIRHLGPGNPEGGPGGVSGGPNNNAQPKGKAPSQMMLTRIFYDGRVWNNNKDKISRVYDNVLVYHFPAEKTDAVMDPNNPPKNSLYLRCDQLTVYTRELGEGRTDRLVAAKGRVDFRSDNGFGRAESVTYEESGDKVIFEGSQGNPAVLWQVLSQAARPREIRARKILYNRRTGAVSTDGTEVLTQP